MSQGRLQPAIARPGTIVPAYEVLDAVNRVSWRLGKDGGWVIKFRTHALFMCRGWSVGMDNWDYMAWMFFGAAMIYGEN